MQMRIWSRLVLAGALLLAAPAGAAPQQAKQAAPAAAVKRLVFEDEEVRAGREGGAGEIIEGQVRARLDQLIVIRSDFLPELLKSAENL